MDLGILLEFPLGSRFSSWVGACTCTFLPSCTSSVRLPVAWIKGSVAFPWGFPKRIYHEAFQLGFRTGISHVQPCCESNRSSAWKSGSAGKTGFPGMDWHIWGTLGMVARPWSSSRLSCGEHLLMRCVGNSGNSFPTTQGKDPSSRAMRWKRGSSGCGRDSRASSRVETGMSGNFLRCRQGVKEPLEVPEVRCD